eukprot:TRINITY_DN7845_c0_g1_i1.p1 TRINITY_DN7845_c0_g1~~TRINITY_DN7845_c0_g1_i1.p1  ORF type:complete len:151 (+),score=17.94 TRINITY_DN7845_c0_g1_i1:181-633(+)
MHKVHSTRFGPLQLFGFEVTRNLRWRLPKNHPSKHPPPHHPPHHPPPQHPPPQRPPPQRPPSQRPPHRPQQRPQQRPQTMPAALIPNATLPHIAPRVTPPSNGIRNGMGRVPASNGRVSLVPIPPIVIRNPAAAPRGAAPILPRTDNMIL